MTRARVLSCGNEEVVFWTGEIAFIRLKMAKMLTLVAFLVGISCALAQNGTSSESAMPSSTGIMATPTASPTAHSTTQPSPSSPLHMSTPMPSPTPMPSHTPVPSPTPVPSHTPMPSPTPTPAPPPPQEDQFFLNYTGTGRLCLHMEAAFDIAVNYTNHTEILHKKFMLSDNIRTSPESMCNATLAKLVLSWRNDSNFILTFTFNTSDPNHNSYWQEGDVTFNYITSHWFPGYSGNLTSGEVEFGYSKLVDDANSHIEFNRSYQCNDSRNFAGHDARTNFSFILNMRNFSVQAFSFRNSSSGEFENPRTCEGGNTSKIVPIAVGAALAGLVIVVLIAYLIGRFRNRKQSSYEALS